MSMIQRVATPYFISILLNLLLIAPPDVKVLLLKIFENFAKVDLPGEIFDEAVTTLHSNHKIVLGQSTLSFSKLPYISFIFGYLLSIREKIWDQYNESDHMYATSLHVSSLLRFLCYNQKFQEWRTVFTEEIVAALKNIDKLSIQETDVVFSLILGGEFAIITAGS